jgi:hypothetical protein
MLLLFLCLTLSEPLDVHSSSVIQLKSVYSKNRLCVTTDLTGQSAESASIYSTRPTFDDGWLWTVEPSNDTLLLTRDLVDCGASIVLSNPVTSFYLATRSTSRALDVVPAPYVRGDSDFWRMICRGARRAHPAQERAPRLLPHNNTRREGEGNGQQVQCHLRKALARRRLEGSRGSLLRSGPGAHRERRAVTNRYPPMISGLFD